MRRNTEITRVAERVHAVSAGEQGVELLLVFADFSLRLLGLLLELGLLLLGLLGLRSIVVEWRIIRGDRDLGEGR